MLWTDRSRFLDAGMDGYVVKPIQKDVLNAEIIRCLKIEQKKSSDSVVNK